MRFSRELNLVVVQCCSCGVEYAIPRVLHRELLDAREGKSAWCPNGHSWHYISEPKSPPKVYETSAPRDECPVCHRSFIRLSTHRTAAKHWNTDLRVV